MPATTYTWSNSAGGDWTVPADWDQSSYPNGSTVVAIIGLAGSYTVSLSGTDPAVTVGTLSITDTSATLAISTAGIDDTVAGSLSNAGTLRVVNGATVAVAGNLLNTGALLLDGDAYTSEGGSSLTVAGTLTNSGAITVGPPSGSLTASDTLAVGALAGTGGVGLYGGSKQATFDIAAAAPGTLGFNLSLYSDALLQYGGGKIGTIASNVTLLLDGQDALIADAGTIASDSALTGLTDNAGTFRVINGATVAVTGNLLNTGAVLLDGDAYTSEGGSTITVAGTLTNSGGITVGPPSGLLTANDTLSVGALVGTGGVGLYGGSKQATFDIGAAAPGTLGFNLSLYSDALLQYGGGQIGTIASNVTLLLDGQDALIADAGTITSDSALKGLTENDGTLRVINGATVAVSDNLLNTGAILLDGDAYTSEGGSTLTVAGTLTNSGGITVGPPSGNLTANDTLSVGALAGTGGVGLYGGSKQATFDIAAAAPGTLGFNLSLYSDALLQYGGGKIGTIASNVTLLLDGQDALIADAGTIASDSALTGLTDNAGTFRVINGATVAVAGNLLNTGAVLLDGDAYTSEGGSTITVAGTLTNSGGITVGPPSGLLTANDTLSAGALANSGAIDLYAGAHQARLLVAGAASNSDDIYLSSGATLSATGAFSQSAGATQVDGVLGGSGVTLTGGSLYGDGTIIAGTLTVAGATVFGGDTGGQPGTLSVTGAYNQTGAGVLIADLGGTSAGQFSKLAIIGAATLGGTLDVNAVNGFTLANGQLFTVLSAAPGQLSGGFSALEYNGQTSSGAINLGNGLFMAALYNDAAGTVEIEVTNTLTAITWTNPGSGSWTNPANWNPTEIPGAGDAVVVPSLPAAATLSLNGSDSLSSLNFQGGGGLSIGAGDTLTVTTGVRLPGTITGGGVLEIQNQLTNTASISIQNGTLQLDAGVPVGGTLATAAGGTVLLPNGATVAQIEALETTNQGTIAINGTFSDTGQTLQVTHGTVEFQNVLNNTGSIVVNGATLKLDGGLTGNEQITLLNHGVLDVNGSTLLLEIGAGNTYSNGGVLEATGPGVLQIDAGTLNDQGATLFANGGIINLTGGLVVAGGTLASANGGVIQSTSGNSVTLGTHGTTLLNSGAYTVDGNSTTVLAGTVSNTGVILDYGSLQIGDAAGDGAALTNQAGGVIDLAQSNVDIIQAAAGTNTFTNDGTLEQTGGGNNYVQMPLVNNGLVAATNGFLELQGGVLGGTIADQGGQIGLIGTYSSAANTTESVTFQGANLGWNGDGAAYLAGPGTLLSNGYVYISYYYGDLELSLTGGITWDNAGTVYQGSAIVLGAGTLDTATIVNQAGATFDLTNGAAQIETTGAGPYSFVNAGTLEQTGGGSDTIYTSLTNTGLVTTTNGNLYLAGPLISNTGTFQSDGGFLELSGGGTLGGTIESLVNNLGVVGTYSVAAHTTDTVTFEGADLGWENDGAAYLTGPGTVLSNGYVYINQYYSNIGLYLTDGITLDNAGTVYQTGTILLGAGTLDTATIVNQAGAIFDLTTNASQILPDVPGTYRFVNAGTLEQTGGGSDTVDTSLTNSGLVTTTNGNLYLAGTISNSGTLLANGGFLELSGGGTLGGTIESLANNVAVVGTYTVAANTTDTVTFGGANLGWEDDGAAYLTGPGTLLSNGYVYVNQYYSNIGLVLSGGITWDNAGTVIQNGTIVFGAGTLDSATIVNQAGAILELTTGASQIVTNGTGVYSFVNDGTLEQTGGGSDYVYPALTNAGLVTSSSGNLYLAGASTNSGTIQSVAAGFVEVQGGVLGGTYQVLSGNGIGLIGTYTLAAGLVDTVNMQGATWGWNGDGKAVLSGAGTLVTTGSVYDQNFYSYVELQLANGATWSNAGTVYDGGPIQLGAGTLDTAAIVNQSGAIFDLTTGASNLLTNGTGIYSFVNAGTLEQTGGGSDDIDPVLTNSGLVTTSNGNLYLVGASTNTGTIQANGGFLEVQGGVLGGTYQALAGSGLGLIGTYTLAAGLVDTVTLQGATWGWNGDGAAVLSGAGTLVTIGSVYDQNYYGVIELQLVNGATWSNTGTVYDAGPIQLGAGSLDTATIVNQAGAVFDLTSGASALEPNGAGTYGFVNFGTLEQTGGGGDYVEVPLTNSGLITTTNGNLYLQGLTTNTGTIVNDGGLIELEGGVLGGTIEGVTSNAALIGTYTAAAGSTDTVSLDSVYLGNGGAGIASFAGPGTIATTSASYVVVQNYYSEVQLYLTGGITWDNAGYVQADGPFQFGNSGTDTATLVNQATGVINLDTGASAIDADGPGTYTLVNAGLLEVTGGGAITVAAAIAETATGTIVATNGSLTFSAGGTISGLVNGPNAVSFTGGNVTVTATGDITAAAVNLNAGTVTMLGGTIASAALWIAAGVDVTGYGAIGDLVNNGTIDAAAGLLTVNGNVTGSGSLQVETGATLELTGSTSQNVTFDGIDATLKLDATSGFTGALEEFGGGDTIIFGGETLSAVSIASNELIGTLAAGGTIAFSAPNINAGLRIKLTGTSTVSLVPSPVSAVPLITTPLGPNNSIVLPQVHVGALDQQALAIENTATAPADGLNVGLGAITGDATAAGSITSLAPGATNNGSIVAGVRTATAGDDSGTVGLTFQSNGSVSGVAANLGDATLNISGSVYRYAAPSVTAPTGVILHVGAGGGTVTEALTVSNTDPADGYSEGLDAVATGVASGNLTGASGSSGDIAAGSSSTALGVTFSTATAGTVSGSVDVALTSDGTGIDSLGLTPFGTSIGSGGPAYTEVTGFTKDADIQTNLIAQFPTGAFVGSNSFDTPFDITSNAGGDNFEQITGTLTIPVSISNATNVYTLLNAYDPASGASLATVEFIGSGGADETFTLVDGVDVRDWYHGAYANSINGTTTQNAYTISGVQGGGGTGNVNTGATGTYVIDEQDFALAPAFASQTLTSIKITNLTGSSETPILLGLTTQSSGTYSAVGDFSTASNANGVWSYLAGGARLTTAATGSNYAEWWNAQSVPNSASVIENTTSTNQTYSNTIVLPPSYLNLDPESLANVAVAFTAPTAGVYTFTGGFRGDDTNENAHTVAVVVNGGTVESGTISSYGQTLAVGLTETLAAGGTVDFASDTGASYNNLSTGLSLQVTLDSGTVVPVTATIDNYATAAIQQASGPGTLVQSGTTYTISLGSVAVGPGQIAENLDVANIAAGPADWLSGSLSATGGSAFSDTGLGAFGTLSAGGTTPLTIDLSTVNAGVFSQTITLAATDSNAAGFSEALPSETVTVTGTVLSNTQLAQPVINEPTPIVLPNAHVAALIANDQTLLSISNFGSSVLSGAVQSSTGNAYGSGAFSGLADGLTNTTGIVAGLNNTAAGAKSGSVTLSFSSGTNPPVPLASQSVSLTGNVYRYAAPSLTAPLNVYGHVGDGGGTETAALVATNTDPADGYSEALDATELGLVSGGFIAATGSVTGIVAGGSNTTALKLSFSTATAATITGTVAVRETSDGNGIDGLNLTQLGTVDVPVTVTVDNYATAAIEQSGGPGSIVQAGSLYTLNLGTLVAASGSVTAGVGVFNIASGPADALSGSLSATGSAAFTNSGLGATGTLGAGSGDPLQIALSAASTGIYSETIVFAGTDSNASGFSQAVGGETLVVTGTVQGAALPELNTPSPINFGAVRQGTTVQQALSVSNTAAAGGARLDASISGTIGAGTGSGAVVNLAPGATDSTDLLAGLNTGTVGVQSGTVTVGFSAVTGSGTTPDGSGTVAVKGTVYQQATATLTSPNLVYLHSGGTITEYLTAQNTDPADGYSENLLASVAGVTGAIASGTGTVTVGPNSSNSTGLSVAIHAGTTAGVFTGNVLVDTETNGTGIDGLGVLNLGTVAVPVTYEVDNYATAELAQTGGNGLMTPTGSASVYTLNLGATEQGAAALTADLEALNAAQGPAADLLGGTFTVSGATEYANSGFTAFSGLTYGTADTAPDVVLNTGTVGTFSETIVLAGTGSNPSGYSGVLSKETIDVVGTIIPEPPPAPPPLPTAVAWGDVHITTFDGLYYNFQAEGEFVLAQYTTGTSFQVQARLQPYTANSTVSVITMLAAEVGTARVTIALGRTDAVWINGTGVQFGAVGETMSLGAGGSITETAANSFQVNWATGEVMDVTLSGTYINTNLTLSAADGPGSIQGLMGSDTGQANDFQANGTVISQTNFTSAELYGEFANAWRVTGGSSLMDYLAGQNTATFTDTNFPADAVNISSLPAAIVQVAEQEAIAAGITNPNQQAAAVIDLLVTGNPNAALADASINQTGGVTDAAVINTPPAAVPALGVSAAVSHIVETAGGTTAVTFNAYLTSAAGTDTVIDYAVTAPNATYIGASAFGGTLPSGYVVVPAGQTSASFTVTLPTAVLGAQPFSNLQVTISSTNGDPVFGSSAQTEIDNYVPTAGNPAIPGVTLVSGPAPLGGTSGHYTLNLGTLVAGESAVQARLQIANQALAPSDFLTGSIVASTAAGFNVYGAGTLTPLSAGTNYQGLVIQTNSGTVGAQTETLVFTPTDDNVTGYSTILPSQTITVTDTVMAAAKGTLETSGPINLGTFYQGAVASTALKIANTAAAGSAGLDVSASVASGSATAAGSISGLAPGATNNTGVYVGISTAAPGVETGVVTVSYTSDAGGGNTVSEGSTQVAVTGTVYGPATAYLAAAPIYVHQGAGGGRASTTITVSNTAPNNGYAENLDAQVVGFGPYVTAASGSAVVAPGGSNTTALTAALSTATLGVYSGFVGVALQSNGTGIDTHGTTSLGTIDVPVTINVDQYAVAAFEEISGNGTLTPTGVAAAYMLNLGTVAQYATPLGANLGVLNDVLGASDLLAGSFSISGAPEFVNGGFTPFGSGTSGGLAAQQVDGSPVVVLSTGTVGTFTETVVLTPTDYNPSGYSAVQAPETVTITGTVVAAPPPVPINRVGNSWGDVHITTFDGLYYNFQAEGEFVLSRSTVTGDTFQVQARMQPLGSSSVTLNTEIAAQIGNDRVVFEAGGIVLVDGVAAPLNSLNEVVSLAGGTLEEQSANSYELIWNTGEQLQVTNEGSYLNVNLSLPNSDAGKVQGLLGPDNGNPADDLMLSNGTVLGTTVTYAQLYGEYANSWRVTDATSLLAYGPGQDTASFTNTNFPYNQISLGNLPAGAVAQAEAAAAAAGITDPNLVQAAVEDYLLTGNPDALIGSENVQQQETAVAQGTTLTAAPPIVAAVGVFANAASVVESTSGSEAVGFTVALTSAEANATTVDYQVIDSGPGFLTAAQFGGILPSGTVTIAAGQTSAVFTVALPANVLGAAPDENLQVVISSTNGQTVFAPLAQTEILATSPTEGNPARPLVEQLSGVGTLTASSPTAYVLNLGTVDQYSNPLIAGLGVLNNGVVPADLLSGSFVINGSTLYENSGFAPFTPLGAGNADTAPQLELLTNQIGTYTETITLSPTDSNLTGFTTSLSPVTVVVTGTIVAPPPPAPPQEPIGSGFGDVHLTTFDGLYYNFQAAGEFILTKSTVAGDTFQVQARLQPYGTGSVVSVQTQIGAEIGTDDVTFGVGRTAAVYLDGAAYTFGASGVMTLTGGSVTEIASGSYRVNWNTGESMTVTLGGGYINDTISLTAADANAVQGLLGPDSGNSANDLQLANGTPLGTSITSTELYGAYANAWRVASDATSLLNYGTNQTTATFTDTSFPSDVVQLNTLPASVVAEAQQIAMAAGITDPNLIQAAEIDLLVTGNPNAVIASANVQQQGVNLFGVGVSSPVPLPDVGVSANSNAVLETTTGTLGVGFTVYLTAAETHATTIDYQVSDPGAGFLGQSGVVGGTGSGSVQIAAGQTSGQIVVDLLANALGSQPDSNLQVTVTPTGGEGLVGNTAQTEIVNPVPTAGSPAIALLEQLSGDGKLTGSGISYNLNLGTTVQNASPLYADVGIENGATVPADNLSGLFTINGASEYFDSGFSPFTAVAPGSADAEPVISLNTGTIGTFTETVVLDPTDTNPSGYSAVQSDVTLTVTGTIAAPPPPPPPPAPIGTAFGDVHLTTFDGLYYNFQAVGEFTLAKSTVAGDSYDVQIRTEQYDGGSVSVIDEVAAALGNQSVTFGIGRANEVYLNGTAQAMGVGSVLTVNGDTVQELSSSAYQVTWSTGEVLTVTGGSSYLNVSTALSSTDRPGSVQGLLGSDAGINTDFQPVVSGTTITTGQLYGAFANTWRLSQASSLLNYAPGQTTATFTDLAFPSDAETLASLPAAMQAAGLQEAIQAGITNPNLQQAAALDYIVTGLPAIVVGAQNAQQQGISATAATIAPAATTVAVGVSANSAALVEPASGNLSVGFEIYLTAAETNATTIDYTVTAPGPGYLGASAFGGTLPSGSVTIAAGQTSASFSVSVSATALGTLPSSALQVSITPQDGEAVFAPEAQTTIVNNTIEPGTAAVPAIALLGGSGTLVANGNAYTLALGTLAQGSSFEALSLAIENTAGAGGNSLAGTLAATATPGFTVSGTGPLPVIAAGSVDEDLHVAVNTTVAGSNSETITLTPTQQNPSGYTGTLAPITLTITDTVSQSYYVLTKTPTTISGGLGTDTIVAASNVLYSGDQISPGGGTNTLLLQGAGNFNLQAPTTLSNIQTVDVEDATASQGQVVYLRNGLNLTLNVLDAAAVTLIGAADDDTINLGSGTASVTLGSSGETVNGGSGADRYLVTAATIGATIAGGSGTNLLEVQGGGSAAMGSTITGVSKVILDNSASYNFTANATAGLTVQAGTGSDTVTVGAASQSVAGSTGTLTVLATAAQGGVTVTGDGAAHPATLEITTAGTLALSKSDRYVTVELAAADTFALPAFTTISVQGGGGGDTLTATNGLLYAGMTIAPGGGTNTLLLEGVGQFNLQAPAVLSNIQTVDLQGASLGQPQVVDLRSGLNLTLNVLDAATVSIVGAADNDIINLGSGSAVVTLGGVGETVNGGSGSATFLVKAATIGATITGGTATNWLELQGGGTATMGSNITGISRVILDNSSSYDFIANATAGMLILAGAGNDTIMLGAASQRVSGSTGRLTVVETAAMIGAAYVGGSGTNVLDLQGGGTAVMAGNIVGVTQVYLDNAASYNLTANSAAGLIVFAGTGNDTVKVAAASQTVVGSTGTLTVLATAAESAILFQGEATGGLTTLEITTGGTVTLNSGDRYLTVQLAAADTMALPSFSTVSVQGGGGDDTLTAVNGALHAGETIAPGGGTNTLLLQAAGSFDLRAPAAVSNIQTVDVEDATSGQSQIIDLRSGLNLTLNVLDNANVSIVGAANNDIINLGSGSAVVTLGGTGETVTGGTGGATFLVTAATIGAAIAGGSGTNFLDVQGGGTATMASNITGMSRATLDNSASYDFTANATAGLSIFAGTGNDTIAVGAASQIVVGSSGTLSVQATAALAGARIETGSGPATLEITNGGTATLNGSDTNLTVKLDAATNLGIGALGFITAIGAAAGHDTITAGGANQTLESTGGNDTLAGAASYGDTFLGSSAGLAADLIKGFGGSDVIDITDMVSSSVQPYVYNTSTDQLSVTDGTHSVTLTFSGTYTASSFAAPTSDGHSGTLIKFV